MKTPREKDMHNEACFCFQGMSYLRTCSESPHISTYNRYNNADKEEIVGVGGGVGGRGGECD